MYTLSINDSPWVANAFTMSNLSRVIQLTLPALVCSEQLHLPKRGAFLENFVLQSSILEKDQSKALIECISPLHCCKGKRYSMSKGITNWGPSVVRLTQHAILSNWLHPCSNDMLAFPPCFSVAWKLTFILACNISLSSKCTIIYLSAHLLKGM